MLRRKILGTFSWSESFLGTGGIICILVAMILAISLTFIGSASEYFAAKQTRWLIIAIGIFWLVVHFDYRILVKYSLWIYIVGILLLLLTSVAGEVRNNSKRWLQLGPILFQTSDFMKLALILYLAKILSESHKLQKITDLIFPFAITFFPMGLILLQPDMGTAMVFVPILFAMIFVAGVNIKHLLLVILIGVNLVPLAYFYGLKDYQRARVKMFLFQSNMTQKQRRGEGYQLHQSKIAHGSGGLLGKGLGEGTQNRFNFLPEKHTDFIFAIVGEEWGFMGTSFLLLLYFLLFTFMLFAAYTTIFPQGQLLIVGIVALLFSQTLVNTSMTVGLAPITGLPLPFMSYGGTSLVFSMVCVGTIISIKGHNSGER